MQEAAHTAAPPTGRRLATLVVGAIGVVFGDIGTSPLYAMREIFSGPHPLDVGPVNVLGVLSLIFWVLFIIVSLQYMTIIMRADNQGEGGIMAMMSLVSRAIGGQPRWHWSLMVLGLIGAAMYYGDGMITPAISVLSAVEGLVVANSSLQPLVVPTAVVILVALFVVQRGGTGRISIVYGPITILWFATLATMGVANIVSAPEVLAAVNPAYAWSFIVQYPVAAMLSMGGVVLVVTGAESLYADMGHFGKRPIRVAWYGFVMPALLLNYFGQGALLLSDPTAASNPFYRMVAPELVLPLVVLATLATIIASQAVISGAFSVTRQAIQLGYVPRMAIRHTSKLEAGQIYVPFVNWTLMVGVIALVLGFKDSTHLAAAYGVAVTMTMAIDAVLGFVIVTVLWRWNRWLAGLGLVLILGVDLTLFSTMIPKIAHGGWFPLLIGAVLFTLLSTWKRGRQQLKERLLSSAIDLDTFLASLKAHPPLRVPGTAVYLNSHSSIVPHALLHNLNHNKILHQRLIFATVVNEGVPFVPPKKRREVTQIGDNIYRVTLHYGFMQTPNIPRELERCDAFIHDFNLMETTFFFSRETLVPSNLPGMARWRQLLFVWMARNAQGAMTFFQIPTNRVIELGTQIEI